MDEQVFEGSLRCSVVNGKIRLAAEGHFGEVTLNFSESQAVELIGVLAGLVDRLEKLSKEKE